MVGKLLGGRGSFFFDTEGLILMRVVKRGWEGVCSGPTTVTLPQHKLLQCAYGDSLG